MTTTVPLRKPMTARGQRTRQELLDAAEEVFGEVGFEQAAISEITKRAGVALGTFYVYFPHKLSVFVELVDELGSRMRKALHDATTGLTGRLEIERAGFAAFLEFCSKHRHLYRVIRQAEFVDLAAYNRYYSRLAKTYAHGLERAMDAGEINRVDPEVLAYALMGIADFLGMRFVLQDTAAGRGHVLEQVMMFLRNGLTPKPQAEVSPGEKQS